MMYLQLPIYDDGIRRRFIAITTTLLFTAPTVTHIYKKTVTLSKFTAMYSFTGGEQQENENNGIIGYTANPGLRA